MNDSPKDSGTSPGFCLLLTNHQSTLYASIAALLGGREGAQDVLQETNRVLLEKAEAYDPQRPFLAWALTFARFQVQAWRKRQARDRLVLDDQLLNTLADLLAAKAESHSEPLEALETCLKKLPPEARGLVDARYVQNEPVQNIAARLGRSVNLVSVTLFRIRKTLLDCVRSTLAAEEGS